MNPYYIQSTCNFFCKFDRDLYKHSHHHNFLCSNFSWCTEFALQIQLVKNVASFLSQFKYEITQTVIVTLIYSSPSCDDAGDCDSKCAAPRHYLNQHWLIVNWTVRNKYRCNLNQNKNIFIQENAFENIVCEMTAILSRPQYVNLNLIWLQYLRMLPRCGLIIISYQIKPMHKACSAKEYRCQICTTKFVLTT